MRSKDGQNWKQSGVQNFAGVHKSWNVLSLKRLRHDGVQRSQSVMALRFIPVCVVCKIPTNF